MIEAARIGWHATIKNALETLEIASAKRLLGDIRIDTDTELNRGIYASGAEKTILRIVKAFRHRKAAHVAPGMTVRDIMDSATADKMANFAAHVSKHGIEYLSDESLLQELEQYDG